MLVQKWLEPLNLTFSLHPELRSFTGFLKPFQGSSLCLTRSGLTITTLLESCCHFIRQLHANSTRLSFSRFTIKSTLSGIPCKTDKDKGRNNSMPFSIIIFLFD